MVRLIHLLSTIIALWSATALSSPLQPRQQNADNVVSIPSTTQSLTDARTLVNRSVRERTTEIIDTTYTTVVYTTYTVTATALDAVSSLTSIARTTSRSSNTESRLVPGTIPFPVSFESPSSISPLPNFHTVTVSQTTSTTLLGYRTLSSQAASPLTTSLSSTSAATFGLPSTTISTSGFPSTAVSSSISTCRPSAIPPAPTNEGTVADCTLWYVAQTGDYCYTVAEQFGISVDTFMAWNPSVLPPFCSRMLAGDAYCVQVCGTSASVSLSSVPITYPSETSSTVSTLVASTSMVSSYTTLPSYASISTTLASSSTEQSIGSTSVPATSVSPAPSSTASPLDIYRSYNGDGSAAQGWPTEDQWVSFDYMFDANRPDMEVACEQWGVPDNSDAELEIMRQQIISIGEATAIEPHFILAMIMQESTGCVRVITTAWSHSNPGLMQSFNGTGSCNANVAALGIPGVAGDGQVQTPCPESEIRQQILDGTNGTIWGPGLVQDMQEQGNADVSRWYRTARLYNGGSIVNEDLSLPCCTASYASDIANRLTGWVNAARTFVAG